MLLATAVTLVAAGAEIAGSWRGHSLFLVADAFHLFAHVSIFAVLLIPAGRWHEQGEDAVSAAVLIVVASIAVAVIVASLRRLLHPDAAPPEPMLMLLSLLGLGANVTTALLFAHPARTRWSFRAALAHELSDGALTVAGLVGALAIALFRLRWIDPGLSLLIGLWLAAWSSRLLIRRVHVGREAWLLSDDGHE